MAIVAMSPKILGLIAMKKLNPVRRLSSQRQLPN